MLLKGIMATETHGSTRKRAIFRVIPWLFIRFGL
jgi:hypothetical protein